MAGREKERESIIHFHRQVTLWARSTLDNRHRPADLSLCCGGVRCGFSRRLSITHLAVMEGDTASGAATPYQVKQDEASRPTTPGGGLRKTGGTAIGYSGGLLPGQLALGCLAPVDGLLGFPQQQRSEDEEEGGGALLRACTGARGRSDAGTAVVASLPERSTFNEELQPEELLLVAPLPTASSWRRRSILCGRMAVTTLKFVWSTATATATLVGALLATLVFFWALYPVCTSCVRSRRSSSADSVTAAAAESGQSTLYINQLQVSGGGGEEQDLLTLRASRSKAKQVVRTRAESFVACRAVFVEKRAFAQT